MDVRIGLVGAGWMGKAHVTSFNQAAMIFGSHNGNPVFEIIADVNKEIVEAAKNTLGFNRSTTNWLDVVTDPQIDVVDIATPNAFHYEVAKAALENGKHVYCEKPLTLTFEQSHELAELAKKKGVVNYVGYNNVVNPASAYIKGLINSGKLGEIIRFNGTYDQDSLLNAEIPLSWRHINKLSGSGALGDLGSHLLSLSQYLLGDIKAVQATSKTFIKTRPKAKGSLEQGKVENEDILLSIAQYNSGAIGTISCSRVSAGRKNYLAYEIQGTNGSVYYSLEDMNEVHVYFESDNSIDRGFRRVFLNEGHEGYSALQPAAGIAIGYNDMKVLEVHKLLKAVTQGASYTCNFEFAAKVDATVKALLESAKSNMWVDVTTEGGVKVGY
jgi:predicted dehydrogenase